MHNYIKPFIINIIFICLLFIYLLILLNSLELLYIYNIIFYLLTEDLYILYRIIILVVYSGSPITIIHRRNLITIQ